MELGGGVGDGDERHHDEVWIGFALRCRWAMHADVDLLVNCTANSRREVLTCLVLFCLASFGWRLLCSSWPDFFDDDLVWLGIVTVATLLIIRNKSDKNLTY